MMAGHYHPSQPSAISEYRDRTAIHAKMAGVTKPNFTCASCGCTKLQTGRKPVVPGSSRYGYICADCLTVEMRGYNSTEKPGADYTVAMRDRLKPLLMVQAMTLYEIAVKLGRQLSTVRSVVKKLRKTPDTIFVESWTRTPGKGGPMQARYRWGKGKDAKQPVIDREAEKIRRYESRKPAKHHSVLVQADPLMAALFGGH